MFRKIVIVLLSAFLTTGNSIVVAEEEPASGDEGVQSSEILSESVEEENDEMNDENNDESELNTDSTNTPIAEEDDSSEEIQQEQQIVTVIFDKNAEDASGEMGNEEFVVGEQEKLYENSYLREGYAFDSWNTLQDGSGTGYKDKEMVDFDVQQEGKLILYAQWVENVIEEEIVIPANNGLNTDFNYYKLPDGTIEITGYLGTDTEIVIDPEIDGMIVSSIGAYAFEYSSITSISIPNTVKSIQYGAFESCENLTNVTLQEGLEIIDLYAFDHCNNLKTITIPNSVKTIEDYAFSYCESITEIHIPEGIETLNYSVFNGCKKLEVISLPNSLKSIEDNVFSDCSSLQTIILPEGIDSIGRNTFKGCKSLKKVELPSTIKNINDYSFYECEMLETISFPQGLESIGSNAFYGCKNLKQIVLPDSLTELKNYCFKGCTSLESVILPNNLTSISNGIFSECTKLATITLPSNITSIGSEAFDKCSSLTSISIPSKVEEIGNNAFYACSGLITVELCEGLKTIGDAAFYNCYNLENITIPGSVTKIGDQAFYGCRKLSDDKGFVVINGVLQSYNGTSTIIQIPNTVHTIGTSAFLMNTYITQVSIPSSVTSIEESAFMGCSKLKTIQFMSGSTLSEVKRYTFCDCTALSSINLPDSVSIIGIHAFEGCSSLRTFTFPNNLTKIGESAFESSKIYSVSLPESITEIDRLAFNECTNLSSIEIKNANVKIGYSAFKGCTSLPTTIITNGLYLLYRGSNTSISIPNTVTRIADYAFSDCSSIKTINIPSTVTGIGDSAFEDCSSLQSITLPSNLSELGEGALAGCSSISSLSIPSKITIIPAYLCEGCSALASVSLPYNITEIGKYAFKDCGSLKNNLSIPSKVTDIREYAFSGCTNIQSISIPLTLTNVERYAFNNCKNLAEVNYAGNQIQWNKITISYGNQLLLNATLNCKTDYASLIFEYGKVKEGNGYYWDGNSTLTLTNFEATFSGNPAIQIPSNATMYLNGSNTILSTYTGSEPGNIIKSLDSLRINSSLGSLSLIDKGYNNGINCGGSSLGLFAPINIVSNSTGVYSSSNYGCGIESSTNTKIVIDAVKGIDSKKGCNVTITSAGAELTVNATDVGITCNILDMGDGKYSISSKKKNATDAGIGLLVHEIVEQGSKRTGSLNVYGSDKAVVFSGDYSSPIYFNDNSFAVVKPDQFEVTTETILDRATSKPAKQFNIQPYILRVFNGKGSLSSGEKDQIIKIEANAKEGKVFAEWKYANGLGVPFSTASTALFVNGTTPQDNVAYVKLNGEKIYLVASYKLDQYTITYDLDGGELEEGKTNPEFYQSDSEEILLNNPTKTGYRFIGWSGTELSGNENLEVVIPSGSKGDREYKAHYTPRDDTKYTVYHYLENLENNRYTMKKTDEKKGVTESTIFVGDCIASFDRYTFAGGYLTGSEERPESGEITETTILSDGTRAIYLYYTSSVISFDVTVSSLGNGITTVALYTNNFSEDEIENDILNGCHQSQAIATNTSISSTEGTYVFENIIYGSYKVALYKKGYLLSVQPLEISEDIKEQNYRIRSLGDVNNDNEVDVSDIIKIRDVILKIQKVTGEDAEAADVNKDGEIDVSDIIKIRDRILGVVGEDYQKTNN